MSDQAQWAAKDIHQNKVILMGHDNRLFKGMSCKGMLVSVLTTVACLSLIILPLL